MTIAYVMYKLVQIAGVGYPPVYKESEITFEGGQYTDGVNYVGYLFGTSDEIEASIEKAKPNGMQEIKIDEAKAFILTQTPVNTEVNDLEGGVKYTGLPVADVDGRLSLELSDTEWDQSVIDAGEAQVEKGNAMFSLAETDFEIARVFEDYFTFKMNGINIPQAAIDKINTRRELRDKISGSTEVFPDWTTFRHWLNTDPDGQAVMGRILNSNSIQVAILNTWLMDQLREGDYTGVCTFASQIDDIVTFTEGEKADVNAEAVVCNLPGPIFS